MSTINHEPQAGPSTSSSWSFIPGKEKTTIKLLDLPLEIIEKILHHVARDEYSSLGLLAQTSRQMKVICRDFMYRHPVSEFVKMRPAGLSDSEDEGSDEWNYDNSSDEFQQDDVDDINDMLERFSYGSNYDEDLDELLNGPDYENYAPNEANLPGAVVGEFNLNDNVTEGWGDA